MRRKFLAAREDLVDKVSEIARRKNVTLFGMINDTLEQLVKAEELGDNLSTILEEHVTMKMAKDAGFTVVPDSLWNYLLERTFDKDKVTLSDIWRSTGEWFGRFCQVRAATGNSVYAVERIMKALLWNVSEVSVQPLETTRVQPSPVPSEPPATVDAVEKSAPEQAEGGLMVKCVGSRLQLAQTALLTDFIVGMVSSFGYQLQRKNVARGIISLEFAKKGEHSA